MLRSFPTVCSTLFCVVCSLLLGLSFSTEAQQVPPKRELRGVWIATVENIDWPSARGLPAEQQRREYRRLLDAQQHNGINAVFVQVRPSSDAFYQSEMEPWSKWLTGQQGKAPSPYYDPLLFLVEEAHLRGMEFHAWFNPYRASTDTATRKLAPNHPFRKHPEWFLRYSGKLLYNPGLPAVREYITQVILDVVRRYDIDGVHFDDYFYPYPEVGQVIHDELAFAEYNPDGLKLSDWRRQNVNILVRDLHAAIQQNKRWVKFGISPFGVWMNQNENPEGSATKAFQGYTGLYADAREWMRQGWVDYILPQLYWSTNFRAAAYPVLVDWWARNHFGRHLYIGHGAYRMQESTRSDTTWRNPRELPRQVRLNRKYPADVNGSVFFSARSLMANAKKTTDSLRWHEFRYPALVPTMPWLDEVPPRPAQNVVLTRTGPTAMLTWQPGPAAADGDLARYYVVYRFAQGETVTPDDPRYIIGLVPQLPSRAPVLVDTSARANTAYAYYVTAVDRLHNESAPVRVLTTGRSAEIIVAQAPSPSTAPMPEVPAPTTRPAPPLRPNASLRPTPSNSTIKTKVKTKHRKRGGFFRRLFGGR
ncbi:glycoside hydrolase family 10 protein [Hymenobacter crusticola]|uniref:Glycoside hydrolase n=1 Tax=Hymenobacter crusticola TaxID=1770526 RepID=A0A243WBL6_9BACT|nr:family 10 glycosylhydrolase [Hymenobacter crusticola]OUJ71993.1 glycoside hydrolase [Hymenobacter crusticola]